MARLIFGENVLCMSTFASGQLFAFGSVVLHANSAGLLGQVDGFALNHEIRFGNVEYVADPRGDLVLAGISAPIGLTILPGTSTLGQDTLPIEKESSEVIQIGGLDPISSPELIHPNSGATSVAPGTNRLRINPRDAENMNPTDLASLNAVLDRIQAMGLSNGPISIYDQIEIRPDDREIYIPPDSHLVASIEESSGKLSASPELRASETSTEAKPKEHPAAQDGSEDTVMARSDDPIAAQDGNHKG